MGARWYDVFEMSEQLFDLETYAQLDGDYELDEGRLVPLTNPSPPHGRACAALTIALGSFVKQHKIGEVWCNDTGFVLQETPATVRGPDVAFVRQERIPGRLRKDWLRGAPDLVVEVASPGNRRGDLQRKIGQYLHAGARLVWVVYPAKRKVLVYTPDGDVRTITDTLDGEDVLPGFRLPLSEIFD